MYDVIIGSSFYETVQVSITYDYSGYILLSLNFALFITEQVYLVNEKVFSSTACTK